KRIGTMLLEEQIEFAKTKRARKVSLEVRKSNIFAQKTYYRFGFDITGEKPGYYDGDHEDAIYMEKFLNDDSV
ncbi:MAG: GNAT family N-acetyltransferase, partial [Lactobacillaceae bacterium]|nr:GNAT family N-acetyltransferase [Lactobacillaceae bacterium]